MSLAGDKVEISEDGTKLTFSQWWSNGGGLAVNRDCLSYNHPEHTYNFLKRNGITPEDFGIRHPLAEIKEKEFNGWSRDKLISEILELREQLEGLYRAGF